LLYLYIYKKYDNYYKIPNSIRYLDCQVRIVLDTNPDTRLLTGEEDVADVIGTAETVYIKTKGGPQYLVSAVFLIEF
jgi:hypothetical protein